MLWVQARGSLCGDEQWGVCWTHGRQTDLLSLGYCSLLEVWIRHLGSFHQVEPSNQGLWLLPPVFFS